MYEKALSSGEAAFDPTWMWDELGLGDERDAPGSRKQAPILGHEALYGHFPELGPLARGIAARVRSAAAPNALTATVSEDDVTCDLAYQRFARSCPSAEFACRYALGLAERMDSRLPPEHRTGRMLQVLTVYITQASEDEGSGEPRLLDLSVVGDVLDGTRPTVVPCRLELRDDARLEESLGMVSPGVAGIDDVGVRPLYESAPLMDLLGLVVNALLYATSKDADAHEVQPRGSTAKKRKRETPIFTSETVFHLPGTIDIKTLEQVKKAPGRPRARAHAKMHGARTLASRARALGRSTPPVDQAALARPERSGNRGAAVQAR